MKLLVALSACVVLAFSHVDARAPNNTPPESFAKIAANYTASLLSQDENPTNLQTNYYKLIGMDEAAKMFHIERPGGRVLNELGFVATSMLIPERALASIKEMQSYMTDRINRLEVESGRDSKIMTIIDEFRDRTANMASKIFEELHSESVRATENAEVIAAKLLVLLDELTLKTDECLQLPAMAFRKIFQCNADSRRVVVRMTPDIGALGKISEQLRTDFFDKIQALDSEFATMVQEVESQILEVEKNEA